MLKTTWIIIALSLFKIDLKAQVTFVRIDTLGDFKINFDLPTYDTAGIVFLTGELHGVSSNPMSEFYSLQYFVKYHHTKTILLEAAYTDSYLLNSFLIRGDMDCLELYLSDYPSKYVEIRDALLMTKHFFDSLPNANKFHFLSVDIVENDGQPFGFNLLNLLAEKSVSNSILKSELLKLNSKDSFPNAIEEYESILSKFKPHSDFDSVVLEIFSSYKNWSKTKQNLFKNRQYYLYRNLVDKISKIKSGNFYGQFGYGHIDLNQKCMAYFLNNDPLFRNKVFSIYPFYRDCNSSFYELKNNVGYNRTSFKQLLNKTSLSKGIYIACKNKKYYYLHIGYKEMQELTR